MENFRALEGAIDAQLTPPANCDINQTITWDGSAWVCADDQTVTGWWRVESWSGQDPEDLECANAFDSTSRNVKFYFPSALNCRSTIYGFSVMGIQVYQDCATTLEENSGSISVGKLSSTTFSIPLTM